MPRPPPLGLINVPQIARGQPLSQAHDFAGLLGFSKFPDGVAEELAHSIALARATPAAVTGLTRKRIAAELKRYAKKLRQELLTGQHNAYLRRQLAEARFGWGIESFPHLAALAAAPTAKLLAAVEQRQREINELPQVSPQRQALESAGGIALWLFVVYAADSIRDVPGAWWDFVLAFLDAAEFPTEKLRQHPESLRPVLDGLLPYYRSLAVGHDVKTVLSRPQQ
jgi:hypothetical protein